MDKLALRWRKRQISKNRVLREVEKRIARELEEMDRTMNARRSRSILFNPTHIVGIYHMGCKNMKCPCKNLTAGSAARRGQKTKSAV